MYSLDGGSLETYLCVCIYFIPFPLKPVYLPDDVWPACFMLLVFVVKCVHVHNVLYIMNCVINRFSCQVP